MLTWKIIACYAILGQVCCALIWATRNLIWGYRNITLESEYRRGYRDGKRVASNGKA